MIRRAKRPMGYYDEAVYEDVREGILEIDIEGRIWKVKKWRGSAWGHPSVLVDCAAYRAEHQTSPNGYLQIQLQHRGGRNARPLIAAAHRLVWMHFKGAIPAGLTINHKNGIKYDNRPDNLKLMNHSQQAHHSLDVLGNRVKLRHGVSRMFGELNPATKLDPDKVRIIRESKAPKIELAKQFGVASSTIISVLKGNTWGHVK